MLKKGYIYIVRFVKFKDVQDKRLVQFSIGFKIANSNDFVNVSFTMWESFSTPLPDSLADGDKVKITDIDSLQVVSRNGKTFFNVTGEFIPA